MKLINNLILIIVFVACTKKIQSSKEQPLKVVTTFTIIADMAKNIAKDRIIIESITKPGAEIHDYEPTPKDIVKAQGANAIFWNGMNLERWFQKFFSNLENIPSFTLTKGIKPLSIYEGPYSGKPNPHAWMSTKNALIYIDNIETALSQISPKDQIFFQKNAETYKQQILKLQNSIRKEIAIIPETQRFLVSSEGAFSYLAEDLKMKEAYLWPINAEQQGTPQQIKKVIDLIRKNNIPVIFSESTISDKPARQIAKESGAQYGGVLYVDSLSSKDGVVPSYLKLLEVTNKTIVSGFKKSLK